MPDYPNNKAKHLKKSPEKPNQPSLTNDLSLLLRFAVAALEAQLSSHRVAEGHQAGVPKAAKERNIAKRMGQRFGFCGFWMLLFFCWIFLFGIKTQLVFGAVFFLTCFSFFVFLVSSLNWFSSILFSSVFAIRRGFGNGSWTNVCLCQLFEGFGDGLDWWIMTAKQNLCSFLGSNTKENHTTSIIPHRIHRPKRAT